MSRRGKKKEDLPKDLHSGEHLKPIKYTVEITPKIVTLQLKSKPYLNGKTVLHFYVPISKNLPPFAVGSLHLQTEEEDSLDVEKAVDMMTRARTYIVNNLEGAMRDAIQGLIKEAVIQQWYSPDEIDKGLDTSLDRAAFDRNNLEHSKRFDEITKELSTLGLSKDDLERDRRKKLREFMHPRWFQEWVGIYALQVQTRLRGGARWIIPDKWWGIEAKIQRFRFFEVHEKWEDAAEIRDRLHSRIEVDGIKEKIQAECGPLPDDLLDSLFETGPDGYKHKIVMIACVHAARQLNYKTATMKQARTLWNRLKKLPLYERPSSPEELKRIEKELEIRWRGYG